MEIIYFRIRTYIFTTAARLVGKNCQTLRICHDHRSFLARGLITSHVRRSRGEMYIGHGRQRVCLFLAAFPHYCTDPDVSWGMAGSAL